MQTVNIPTLKQLVKSVAVELNEPLFVVGQFGAGKSEAIMQAAHDLGAAVCDVRLGQYDTVDLRGTPWRQDAFTVWCPASTLPFVGNDLFPDDRPIILFLDELTSATPPVMGLAYQLVNEKRIGEHLLKPNVRIVAAGNRAIDRGIVNRMPEPLKNRFTQVELIIDVRALCAYGSEQKWPDVFMAFWMFRGEDVVCTYHPEKPQAVVATPRTWEKAVKYYGHDMPDHIRRAAMSGCIGEGPSGEFWGFVDTWKSLIPISQIIKDPKRAPLPDEISAQYAMAVSVSGNMTLKTVAPLATYLARFGTELDKPDLLITAWHLALARDKKLYGANEYIDFANTYHIAWS